VSVGGDPVASTSGARLLRLGVVYGAVLAAVLVHLLWTMLGQHEAWLLRSYKKRWSFRDVPSIRGAVRDRFGRPLAEDEPTFELSCIYERFRLHHPVGAAIHGATLWSRANGAEVRYSYADVAAGPAAAAHDLLSLPLASLGAVPLDKGDRRALLHSALVVLGACSELPSARVQQALRAAMAAPGGRCLGDVFADRSAGELEEQFAAILGRLRALDAALRPRPAAAPAADGGGDGGKDDEARGLLARLDRMRIDSLEGRRTRHGGDDGAVEEGAALEQLARPIARDVPFAVAAALRVAQDDQPGLLLEPSLRRVAAPDLPPTLRQLLGGVADLDDAKRIEAQAAARVGAAADEDADPLVPEDPWPSPDYAQSLRVEAQRSYAHVLRTRERSGTSGFEASLDRELAGAPGMRLVERDAHRREQLLWGSLRVQPGTDVALTIDLDLQRLLDERVQATAAHWQALARAADVDPARVDVACAMVDAGSGDVLALASAPTADGNGRPRLPAVLTWHGNGAIGSLSKPLFLVEQFAAIEQGQPHREFSAFEPCRHRYRVVDGRKLDCDGTHGEGARRPATALAKSCNVFFFQLAEDLGEAGLRRALWRFGLLPPPADGADDGNLRLQQRPPELPTAFAAAPRWRQEHELLQKRGIGYAIEANPLALARAYAALATGELPTLACRRGEARPHFALGIDEEHLDVVRTGLRECVETGTAEKIAGLRQFDVLGKTGTAEIDRERDNNAWFAGWLPVRAADGVQLCFCAVVYCVPNGTHGAEAAGTLVAEVLQAMNADETLAARYLRPESGR
jgi:cell division protein FtsI/penicillin-binding protein 2